MCLCFGPPPSLEKYGVTISVPMGEWGGGGGGGGELEQSQN